MEGRYWDNLSFKRPTLTRAVSIQKGQNGGEEAFKSLSALGNGLNLHNATNDCVAQVVYPQDYVHDQHRMNLLVPSTDRFCSYGYVLGESSSLSRQL